ncbi:nitrate/nitrite transporter [[Mycobacterium] holstebronense]|uniref:Nitrate/nitrite transporter n=1 Tax=[Mycobacterium] holstebronense TaxID=3064288 RepID=A0ABN9NH49_9MYCO|nr:nitrate/nitrite transporter [Mycolicibacter sp. MU0102]CAJ1504926.1 nitrate/nitrite transporter [Mycolicibacter sp. MU0102]
MTRGDESAPQRSLTGWDAEDVPAWEAGNSTIARRNLLWLIACDHIAFGVWTLWPVLALFMPASVYGFSPSDKFLLGATSTLVAASLRIPYSLGIAKFGGRNWTVSSIAVLVIPTAGAMVLLAHPGLPLWPYLVCAGLTGCGGANYSASMTNTNRLYPQRLKGLALGLNAGVGNLGVPMIQLVGLLVLATTGHDAPYIVCALYLALLVIVGAGATRYLDNLDHATKASHLREVLSKADTWVLALLYLGSFGSWIGFSFAFGVVLQTNFTAGGQTPVQASLHAAQFAFIGPALGSLARIYGGRLADRLGGSRVTLAVFAAMAVVAGALITISIASERQSGHGSALMDAYIATFVGLFILAGLGNGSVYKMIPSIFEARSHALNLEESQRRFWSQATSGAVIGFVATFGALGGVGINLALRQSYLSTGAETSAFWVFIGFYFVAALMTWSRYVRRPTRTPGRLHDVTTASQSEMDVVPATEPRRGASRP